MIVVEPQAKPLGDADVVDSLTTTAAVDVATDAAATANSGEKDFTNTATVIAAITTLVADTFDFRTNEESMTAGEVAVIETRMAAAFAIITATTVAIVAAAAPAIVTVAALANVTVAVVAIVKAAIMKIMLKSIAADVAAIVIASAAKFVIKTTINVHFVEARFTQVMLGMPVVAIAAAETKQIVDRSMAGVIMAIAYSIGWRPVRPWSHTLNPSFQPSLEMLQHLLLRTGKNLAIDYVGQDG